MRVGHRQETNRAIVEESAPRIPNHFGADPEQLWFAREGELDLKPVAAPVGEDRQRIENHPVLADASHESGKHFLVAYERGIEGHGTERLTMSAGSHELEATGSGFAGQETHGNGNAPYRSDSKVIGAARRLPTNLV